MHVLHSVRSGCALDADRIVPGTDVNILNMDVPRAVDVDAIRICNHRIVLHERIHDGYTAAVNDVYCPEDGVHQGKSVHSYICRTTDA